MRYVRDAFDLPLRVLNESLYDLWMPGNGGMQFDMLQWIYAIYWAMACTLGVGMDIYPHTILETVFTVLVSAVGVFMVAFVVGGVGIVDGRGGVTERVLADHAGGIALNRSVTLVANTVSAAVVPPL